MTELVNTETGEILNPNLNDIERKQLEREESVIEAGAARIGQALTVIRDQRLYRETHSTFEVYCLDRWGITPQHANRQVALAKVLLVLEPMGSIPERQARELAPMLDTPDLLVKVWETAAAESDGKPTAASIREVRERHVPAVVLEPQESPEPRPQRRAPLPDSYFRNLHDLSRKADSLIRLTKDDRYAANRAAVTGRYGSDALRALLTIGAAVAQLDPATLAEKEEARQWWLTSLNEITEVLADFGTTLKES